MKLAPTDYAQLLEALLAEGQPVSARLQGHSMLPAIAHGALVHLRPVAGRLPSRGEVALVRRANGCVVCHRVRGLRRRRGKLWVQTWGDAAHFPDAPEPVENVLGVVSALGEERAAVPAGPPRWRLVCRRLKYAVLRRLQAQAAAEESTVAAQ